MFGGFILVGIASTLCNLGSRYLFQRFSSYEVALAGANTIGVLSAYFLNRWLVFKPRDTSMPGELARFALINLAGIVVSWLTSVFLYRQVFPVLGFSWQPDLVAHALGIAVPVIPNYWAHRHWTFARR
jgi:putative flippase GtrA